MEIQRMDERQFTILTETLREHLEAIASELARIRKTLEDK